MPSWTKDPSAPDAHHAPYRKTIRKSFGKSVLVFIIGIIFTWQIFELIMHRHMPTMQETMEDTANELQKNLGSFLNERVSNLRILSQVLAYRPLLTEKDFSLAAADIVERFPEWRWIRYQIYAQDHRWSSPFTVNEFNVPIDLDVLMEKLTPHDEASFAMGAFSFVIPIEDTEDKLYAVKMLIRKGANTEGELWAVIDLTTLLDAYFTSQKNETYHYIVSLKKETFSTDLGFHFAVDHSRPYQVTRYIKWSSHTFRIDAWPKPYFLSQRTLDLNMDLAGTVILVMGLIFSVLIAVLAWTVSSRTQILQYEVTRRTAELSKKNALLRGKNEEIENFIYTISHDLKSPIVSIQGFATILKDEYGKQLDETAVSYLTRIQSNAVRMHHLIQDLLELSRIGQVEELADRVNVRQVVQDIVKEHRSELEKKNFDVNISPDLPTVTFPKIRIQQVFDNLITNAIKYADTSKKPELRIEVNGHGKDDDAFHFMVRDNGIGIKDEYQEKIFQIFQRVHNDHDIEGTGIGLSIVKKIIEQQGGSIEVDSEVGKGSTFHFSVPKSPVSVDHE